MKNSNNEKESCILNLALDGKPKQFEDVPEGKFRASLFRVKRYQEAGRQLIWLIPADPADFLVASRFKGGGMDVMRSAVAKWLGPDFDQYTDNGEVDLTNLIGLEADILVEHRHNEKYPKPYIHAPKFTAPGVLIARTPAPATLVEKDLFGLS
jgi:hypothetical protein